MTNIIQPASRTIEDGIQSALIEAARLIHANRSQGGVTIPKSTPQIDERVVAELRAKGYEVTPSTWSSGSWQVRWGIKS